MVKTERYVVGIDEAGRGPLAGPVSIGAVMVREDFNKKFFKGIKDSKQLNVDERELWYALASEARRRGELFFCVSLVSESIIDKHGIAAAIRLGIKRCLKKLEVLNHSQIFLDGGIKAPIEFVHQTTIIRGDEKVPVISLASICAKVVRDRRMVSLSKLYPEYSFHVHKGYGTRMHREAIKKYGSTRLHRATFLTRIDR